MVEISPEHEVELTRRSAALGKSVDEVVGELLDAVPAPARSPLSLEAIAEIKDLYRRIGANGSSSGRNGKPWREWIHEGHKY